MKFQRSTFYPMFMKLRKKLTPSRIIVLGFLSIILIGACLLKLPFATREGVDVTFLETLFTSTSATCVTGLIVKDTYTTWSTFGLIVIICLIQIGGIGFMSIISIFLFLGKKKIGLSQRLLLMQSMNISDFKGVIRLLKHVLYGTFMFEGCGAIILTLRFLKDMSFIEALGNGVFHSISAFCNAGFDLMGKYEKFSSLSRFQGDFVVTLCISALIIIGGIGFYVWEDLCQKKSVKRLSTHTKLVISITAILLVGGTVLVYLAEMNNPETLGKLSTEHAILNSFFQSVTARTAGFNTLNQAAITDLTKIITVILMFIGGSPGSTAGGAKTSTIAVLFLVAFQTMKGKNEFSLFKRRIDKQQVITSLSLVVMMATILCSATIIIALMQPFHYIDILYECTSAIGTVGITAGITTSLNAISQLVIISLMFFGRVGLLTLAVATLIDKNSNNKTKYPKTWIMIG